MSNATPKARPQLMTKPEDGTYGRNFCYTITQPMKIEQCLTDNFFRPCLSNVLPGDTIRVVEKKDNKINNHGTVTASCQLMVTHVHEKGVEVKMMGGDFIRYETEQPAPKPEPKPEPDVRYIDGDGSIEKRQNSDLWDVKQKGRVIASVKSRAHAQKIVRGDVPIPPQE